jgi:predicted nuclease of restriction endonuclease-like RecB superfamily
MTRDQANVLMGICEELGKQLNFLAEAIEGIEDMEEKKKYRRAVADLMAAKYIGFERRIVGLFPDLDPDK